MTRDLSDAIEGFFERIETLDVTNLDAFISGLLALARAHLMVERAFFITRRGGVTVVSSAKGVSLGLELAEAYWRHGEEQQEYEGCWALISIPVRPSDPLTKRKQYAVFALESAPRNLRGSSVALSSSVVARLRGYLLAALERNRAASMVLAHRRLATFANHLVLTKDITYKVAREIRKRLSGENHCLVFRLEEGALDETRLVGVAQLGPRHRRLPAGASDVRISLPVDLAPLGSDLLGDGVFVVCPRADGSAHTVVVRQQKTSPLDDASEAISTLLRKVALSIIQGVGVSPEQVNAIVLCPLRWRSSLLGLVVVFSLSSEPFSLDEVVDVAGLAQYAVGPFARDDQFASELALLDTTSVLDPETPLESNRPLKAFLQLLCQRIRSHRGATCAIVAPFDATVGRVREESVVVSYSGGSRTLPTAFCEVIAEGGIDSERECHATGELQTDYGLLLGILGVSSLYSVPLRANKQTSNGDAAVSQPVGVLVVGYDRLKGTPAGAPLDTPAHFSDADKKWLRYYARTIEKYISQHDRISKHSETERAILRLYESLDAKRQTNDTLTEIFQVGVRLVGATAGVLAIPCSEHRDLVVVAEQGLDPSRASAHIAMGSGVTGHCAESRSPITIADSNDPRTWPPAIERLPWVAGSKTEMAVPLLADGDLVGVLDVESQTRTAAFDRSDLEALTQLARAGVIAVELTQQLQQLRTLRDVAHGLAEASRDDDVFSAALEAIRVTTGAQSASARVLDPTQRFLEGVLHVGVDGQYRHRPIALDEGVNGWAYTNQQVCLLPDVLDRRTWPPDCAGIDYIHSRENTRCELAVPVTWSGDRLGVINVEHVQPGALKRFRSFIETIADQVAHILYQRRQQKRELRAKDIEGVDSIAHLVAWVQHEFKPKTQALLDVAARVSPGAEGAAEVSNVALSMQRDLEQIGSMMPARFVAGPGVKAIKALRRSVERYVTQFSVSGDCFHLSGDCSIETSVYGHERILEWCLDRVLENSLAYSQPNPKVDIEVTMSRHHLQIVIGDNGPGVSPAELREMYDWHKRESTARRNGAALPMCRQYIGAMNGTIISENRQASGLRTTIVLQLEPS